MDQSVFVTGGCGFLGTQICLTLLQDEYRVVVYDNFRARGPETLLSACKKEDLPNPEIIEGDVGNYERLKNSLQNVSAIIHLAAFTDVVTSVREPKRDFETNIEGTFNILELARENPNIQRVIFASSNAAVGEKSDVVNEKSVPKPISPYGSSKLYGEGICSSYASNYSLKAIALRFANAYGPYAKHKNSVIPKFVRLAKKEQTLTIYGDGQQTRDFVHSSDIARAIKKSLELSMETSYELFQIGSGQETEIKFLANLINNLVPGKNPPIQHVDPRSGEIRRNVTSIRKAQKILDWNPHVSLQEGLKELLL